MYIQATPCLSEAVRSWVQGQRMSIIGGYHFLLLVRTEASPPFFPSSL